jgi:hypothetical protein
MKEKVMRRLAMTLGLLLGAGGSALLGCGDDDSENEHGDHGDDHGDDRDSGPGEPQDFAQTLFVGHEGTLVSYDVASGDEKPGTVTDVQTPVDLQALEDGTLLVNLTNPGQILFVDGTTMLETARIASSGEQAERPVHTFVSPKRGGKQYLMTMNDGSEADPATNSAAFVDIAEDSAHRFELAGEVALGVGHHKAAFSTTQERVVISNIGDCDDVISVFDYSDIHDIQKLATLSGADAGFDAEDPGDGSFDPAFCDVTYSRGLPPAPHGCATSRESGKVYCNITSSGAIAVVDVDADEPTFELLTTHGSGGGYSKAHPGGRYIYTVQESPREGAEGGGDDCQVGQIVVIDTASDTVVSETPLLYKGPDCTDALAGTAAESANPDHMYFSADGDTLFVPTAGGFEVEDARVDQLMVLDTSDPAAPVQLDSIEVGVHTGHSSAALSGDGKWLFVVHTVDGTVSQIDVAARNVEKTIDVGDDPKVVATYGSSAGPSVQTGPIH